MSKKPAIPYWIYVSLPGRNRIGYVLAGLPAPQERGGTELTLHGGGLVINRNHPDVFKTWSQRECERECARLGLRPSGDVEEKLDEASGGFGYVVYCRSETPNLDTHIDRCDPTVVRDLPGVALDSHNTNRVVFGWVEGADGPYFSAKLLDEPVGGLGTSPRRAMEAFATRLHALADAIEKAAKS